MRKTLRKTVKKNTEWPHKSCDKISLSTEEWSKYLLFVIQFSKSIMPITL